jgi:hypothetical protein
MNADTLKLFRIAILIALRGSGGSTVNELVVNTKPQGYSDVTPDTVKEELQYLADKKHVEKVPAEISPEVESFRVTAAGRDWLAVQGLK